MQIVQSFGMGLIALAITGAVIKGIFVLLEATQGELGRWVAYGCLLFVAFLVGDAIIELRKRRER